MKKTHVELMNADSLCTAKEELSNSINPNPIKKNLNHTGLYTRGIWYHLVLGQLVLLLMSSSSLADWLSEESWNSSALLSILFEILTLGRVVQGPGDTNMPYLNDKNMCETYVLLFLYNIYKN